MHTAAVTVRAFDLLFYIKFLYRKKNGKIPLAVFTFIVICRHNDLLSANFLLVCFVIINTSYHRIPLITPCYHEKILIYGNMGSQHLNLRCQDKSAISCYRSATVH